MNPDFENWPVNEWNNFHPYLNPQEEHLWQPHLTGCSPATNVNMASSNTTTTRDDLETDRTHIENNPIP